MFRFKKLRRIVAADAGGALGARAVLLYAAVLGLSGADAGAVGAMADPLQDALGIGKVRIALLLTASLGVGAAATLPFGWLVDRTNRTRLLAIVVAAWGGIMLLCATAPSFGLLLTYRLALGGAGAAALPAIASLIGDGFDPDKRGRIYAHVLSGELVGTAVGFLVAGELGAVWWRLGFAALAAPAAWLAWSLRSLREPPRGGKDKNADGTSCGIATLLDRYHVQPRERLVLHEDAKRRSIWWALRYVLAVPTNRILIVASALVYFYFTGLRAFGVEYVHDYYHLSHGIAVLVIMLSGAGALAGVILGGHTADALIAKGRLSARVLVAAIANGAAAVAFCLALLVRNPWGGMLLVAAAAAFLGAVSPPLDAARLDVMPAELWGRAESVRTCLRKAAEALAPLAFAFVATHVFGGEASSGLHDTLLVMVTVLGAGAVVGLLALRTYPRDVATARASARRTKGSERHRHGNS